MINIIIGITFVLIVRVLLNRDIWKCFIKLGTISGDREWQIILSNYNNKIEEKLKRTH